MNLILLFILIGINFACGQSFFPTDEPLTEYSGVTNFGRCITPGNENGLCIYLDECSDLYNILLNERKTQQDIAYLRRSQCGYNSGKVLICCSLTSVNNRGGSTGSGNNNNVPTKPPVPPTNQFNNNLLPQPGTCGKVIDDRIYGGNETERGEFPWMALLEYTKPGNRKDHHCGGSLINDRYVLTAAHCVKGKGIPADWRLSAVRLGEWDTKANPDCETDQRGRKECSDPYLDVSIEQAIVHEGYQPSLTAQYNDIALLRLSRSVPYTDWIRPVCLPSSINLRSANFEGVSLDVAGWGKTELNVNSQIKLKALVNAQSINQCNSIYSRHNIVLRDSQICAGGAKGIDSCRGDSGGPLIGVDNTSGARSYNFLAGIVSFGPTPCGLEGWPGVYTRVGAFTDWIGQNIKP